MRVGRIPVLTGLSAITQKAGPAQLLEALSLEAVYVASWPIDRNYRPQASNCIHAVSDIDTDNGLFHLGREWGEAASRDVANHLRRWVNNPEKTYPWVSERLEPRDFPIEGQTLEQVRP